MERSIIGIIVRNKEFYELRFNFKFLLLSLIIIYSYYFKIFTFCKTYRLITKLNELINRSNWQINYLLYKLNTVLKIYQNN